MRLVKLTDEQLIDLVFEKEIVIDNIAIRSKDSFLRVLAKLDERLSDGKIFKREDTVFCESIGNKNTRVRGGIIKRSASGRRKSVNGPIKRFVRDVKSI